MLDKQPANGLDLCRAKVSIIVLKKQNQEDEVMVTRFLVCICLFIFSFGSLPVYSVESKKKAPLTKEAEKNSRKKETISLPPEEVDRDTSLSNIFKSLDYPELQMAPSASESLQLKSRDEAYSWWYDFWPFYLSSAATIGLGFIADKHFFDSLDENRKRDAQMRASLAKGVGGIGILGAIWLASRRPYQTGWKKIQSISKSGRRSKLVRERMAEETLERAAKPVQILQPIFAFTNLFIILSVAKFVDFNSNDKTYLFFAGAMASAPLFFENWYIYNYKKHQEYKRNIFLPVISMAVTTKPAGGLDYYPILKWSMAY